ncbi:MAG TPA: PIN domain-containing protein [Bryobacteraceae bacterium]|jgi:predicted nucleic acid-binding protein|nr:PIN domain-containing protein [Bryobacteraceae bacterium]
MVLDANILIRGVLGVKVFQVLFRYAAQIDFAAPDTAFHEAKERLPGILQLRGVQAEHGPVTLETLGQLVRTVEPETYAPFETIARRRIERRDADDWPVLAAALALGCPIWTEDKDFFGCGVATWTTDRVELYLAEAALH